jgi:hypothetical protein
MEFALSKIWKINDILINSWKYKCGEIKWEGGNISNFQYKIKIKIKINYSNIYGENTFCMYLYEYCLIKKKGWEFDTNIVKFIICFLSLVLSSMKRKI